jgi:hypothetical protein
MGKNRSKKKVFDLERVLFYYKIHQKLSKKLMRTNVEQAFKR